MLNDQVQLAILSRSQDATAIYDSPELHITFVNDAMLSIWGKGRSIVGKTLKEAVPEVYSAAFGQAIKHVWNTGTPYTAIDSQVTVTVNGIPNPSYYDFEYRAIPDNTGKTVAILHTARDVSSRVEARKLATEKQQYEQQLITKLTESGVNLQAANDDLTSANKYLHTSNDDIHRLNLRLQESETDFKRLVEQAPIAILVFRGPEMVIDLVNEAMLAILGKGREIIGKPLLEGMPEIKDAPAAAMLFEVFRTGKALNGNEAPVPIKTNGRIETRYFNFSYLPLLDEGRIIGVMDVAVEVTGQVKARKELEDAKETLNLAIQAAELGTFDMDLEKGTMDWDERCRTLFGISHKNQVSYDHDFVPGLHPEDRARITTLIADEVMVQSVNNGKYDVEYRTIGAEDSKIRWVRAKGKVHFTDAGVPRRFIGAVLDITEQKQDEQRKNDFIGMVSHELKTPLTSLTAIVQVMKQKLKQSEDQFMASAADKANIQAKKMVNMINGFLNISRLESGKIVLNKQEFELCGLIQETIDELQLVSGSHKFTLLAPQPVIILADRDKISSVISNLLSNAVKYSPKRNDIEITCYNTTQSVIVAIKDEGMGIKAQDLKRLFDRYYRVESKHTAHISGFGIGLYLSAEIVKQHGGSIWAESISGNGSTFSFSLPVKI